jgi:hypothetical protein
MESGNEVAVAASYRSARNKVQWPEEYSDQARRDGQGGGEMKAAYFAGTKIGTYDREGVTIEFTRSTGSVCVSGYYDGGVGIYPEELPLADFLARIGIKQADVSRAFDAARSAGETESQP